MIDAVAHKANFTYKLYMPSGMGASCLPEPIAKDDPEDMYNAKYRSQFSKFVCGQLWQFSFMFDICKTYTLLWFIYPTVCGQEDVFNGDSDMYWSLYYITPFRQLRNAFSIPYKPPSNGAIVMFGIGSGVSDFDDLVEQQKEGKQGPICLGESTAYGNYVKGAFPELKYVEVPNTDEGQLQGMKDGNCNITINAYPYALDFIANRYEAGECEINGESVGLIGQPLGFGLSQFGVGVSDSLPGEVVGAISYWLNTLMTCAPGVQEDDCETKSGKSLYEQYTAYGRSDPDLCRPKGILESIIGAVGDPAFGGDLSDLVEGAVEAVSGEEGTTSDEEEDKETATVEETSGNGRMLRTVGAVGAFIGGMLI